MNGLINMKKRTMLFRRKSLRVVLPLDPPEGLCYTKLVCDYEESEDELDQIYKVIVRDQDWINLTVDGKIAWGRESS